MLPQIKSFIIFLGIICICLINAKKSCAIVIPSNDRVNWPVAGTLTSTPSHADTVFQINLIPGTTWDQKIATAIALAQYWINSNPAKWVIIYFPKGVYSLNYPILLNQSNKNIIFQGAGSDSTVLQFYFNGTNQNCIEIKGTEQKELKKYLAVNLEKGSNSLICATNIGYTPPCWIRLSEEDHPYFAADDDWAPGCVGQITRLETVAGTSGILKDVASKQYTVNLHTSIWPIIPVMNIGIENLTIKRMDTGSPGGGNKGINIWFDFAINCWVKGVHFDQTCKHHIMINFSSHVYISGCYFHDARSFEDGGYGYGVMLTGSTTNCLIENNIFHKLRHAIVIQAGSNSNVISYNYSHEQNWTAGGIYYPGDTQYFGWGPGGDICFHGNYPYANLVEHNYCERIVADSHHGDNGKINTIIRNRVTNDHDSDRSWIYIRKAPNSNVVGNMCTGQLATEVEYAYCDLYRDCFGFLGIYGWSHNYFVQGWADETNAFLEDISYYYSSRPYFLPSNYSYPTIGPRVSSSSSTLSQTIPARGRFEQDLKTYILNPTPHYYRLSGTIDQNLILQGYVDIICDVSIPSGYTLMIKPGTIVRANTDSRLTVNGTLKAEGTAAQKIIFTRTGTSGNWYGIRFEDSSVDANCLLKYCDIQYSSYGVYCNRANPRIENNTFSNNTYALYLYYASPSIKTNRIDNDRIYADNSNPYIYDNYVNNPSENFAIYLYHSSPTLYRNSIEGQMIDYAIKASSYSAPQFGLVTDTLSAFNRIEASQGDWAILAENHSMPFLGSSGNCYYGGKKNSIIGNDVLLLAAAHTYSWIDAGYMWWGQYPAPTGKLYADATSSLGYNFALSGDPGGGSTLGKASILEEKIVASPAFISPPAPAGCDSMWQSAEKARADKRVGEALTVYENLMSRYSHSPYAHYSLMRTIQLQEQENPKALTASLQEVSHNPNLDASFRAAAMDGLVNSYIRTGNIAAGIKTAEEIIEQFPGSIQEYTALYNLFTIYTKEMKNEGQGRAIAEKLKAQYPYRELTLIACFEMGEAVEWKLTKPVEPSIEQALVQPEKYSLGNNYPNPFNPVTVIPFSVPEASHIKLAIFNVLGREIVALVDGQEERGMHQVVWDGRDSSGMPVSAGIYFYRLSAKKFDQTHKLLLVK